MAHLFLRRRLVDRLNLRLPTAAQRLEPDCQSRPDFVYDLPGSRVVIYVDGPPHDRPERQTRDRAATSRMEDKGWMVLRFHHQDAWPAILAANPSVFGTAAKKTENKP